MTMRTHIRIFGVALAVIVPSMANALVLTDLETSRYTQLRTAGTPI